MAEEHKNHHPEEEHIEKLICEGFDRTDWDSHPDNPNNFTMQPPEESGATDGANPAHEKATLVRKRVKVFAPSSVGSRLRKSGSRRSNSSFTAQTDDRDPLKTDMKVIIVISTITVILIFAIYLWVVLGHNN